MAGEEGGGLGEGAWGGTVEGRRAVGVLGMMLEEVARGAPGIVEHIHVQVPARARRVDGRSMRNTVPAARSRPLAGPGRAAQCRSAAPCSTAPLAPGGTVRHARAAGMPRSMGGSHWTMGL